MTQSCDPISRYGKSVERTHEIGLELIPLGPLYWFPNRPNRTAGSEGGSGPNEFLPSRKTESDNGSGPREKESALPTVLFGFVELFLDRRARGPVSVAHSTPVLSGAGVYLPVTAHVLHVQTHTQAHTHHTHAFTHTHTTHAPKHTYTNTHTHTHTHTPHNI